MTVPRRGQWNSKALAERRRRAFQFYVAGFSQEEIAEKVGVDRSVVSRDLRAVRESACPRESPDVQEACFIQMERMTFNPDQGSSTPDTHRWQERLAPRRRHPGKIDCAREEIDTSPKRKRGSEHLPSLALRASKPHGGWAISSRVQYRRIYDPKVDGYGPQLGS